MAAPTVPASLQLPTVPVPWRLAAPTGSEVRVSLTLFTDIACPWAYSFEPALRTAEARYGDQLEMRIVVIGLSSDREALLRRGSSPERSALTALRYRHLGMPYTPYLRERVMVSEPACRLIKAAGLQGPGFEEAATRALRIAQFNSPLLLDEPCGLEAVCALVEGLDRTRALADLESPAVEAAFRADFDEARSAPPLAVKMGRAARSDERDRYTAPSLVLESADGRRAVVPGFQPFEAIDVALMNLEPELRRLAVPELADLLALYPGGLTSQEVARVLADTTDLPDRPGAETALTHLLAEGRARRIPLGDDALWAPA